MSKTVCFAGRKAYAALLACGLASVCWATDLPAPIIWWDMEAVSNGKIADKSGNGRDLTLGAGASLTNGCGGATGYALFFAGQKNTWATFPCPALGSRTISFWYRRERGSGPISNGEGNTYPYLITNLSTMRMHFANAADNNVSSSIFAENPDPTRNRYFTPAPSLYREVWTHVTLTFDVTSTEADEAESDKIISHVTYKAYVNGACVAAPATDFALTNFAVSGTAMLGNWSANGTGIRPSYGAVDEFRVWDTALDAEQVWAEYARTKDDYDETGLIGRWTFDDTETVNGSLVLKDVAGLAGDITCGAGIVVTNAGVEGQCVACSGYKDCWGALTLPAAMGSDFTWTCWINQSPDSSKDTLAKIGGDGQNRGPRLLQAGGDWYYINLKGAMPGEWDWTRILVLTPGNNTEQPILNSRAPQGLWSHLAVTTRFKMEADGTRKAYTYAYMNGEYAGAIAERNVGTKAASATWTFANSGRNGANRPIEGMVDDLRLYAGALSSNSIVRLFRGAAEVDAGADFSVAGGMAELHGEIGKSALGDVRKGYAGTPCWTLVSAPSGGEGATILQPGRTVTQVTLPVEGAYVFRLSNTLEDVGLSRSDDVTVTRVASAGAAPTVSVAATATTTASEPCALAATATVDARIHWAKVSGPGGAWFEPENAAATKATFDAAGTYMVRCTAEKDGAAATADVTVTVGDAETCDLSNGLIRWWPLSGADFTKERIANSTRPTMGTNTEGAVIRAFENGPAGYAMRANGFRAYFDLGNGLAETPSVANNNNSPPTERYRAVSAWVWHDSSDTNTFKNAAIFMVPFTLGLWYNYNVGDGTADGLLLCQQGWGPNDTTIAYMKRPYALPHPLTNRWTHVYALFDRSQGTDFELWIDGEKQVPTSTPAGKRGRVRTPFDVGGIAYIATDAGADNGYSKHSTTKELMSRCFPGKVADVRIYNRKLTAREVKKLASDPDVAANRAPAIDAFSPATLRTPQKKAKSVATAVFDDGEPTGGELTYQWSILSGDAAAASFGDATARETTFTATAVGTYVLQLAVSDGERTSYSAPLTVEVVAAGTIVVIK
ncbi:MAG: hypothetical protein IJJ84_04415 [Kiritimatiellae bacterium]|nr:hypothetical protein [Kiritimatiellia bacterium]